MCVKCLYKKPLCLQTGVSQALVGFDANHPFVPS